VRSTFAHFTAVFLALLITSGCIRMGPDFSTPDTGILIPGGYENASEGKTAPFAEDRWWRVFNNPEIDRMVEEALRTNLDIRKAAARILEVRAQFVGTRADRFPRLGFQGQAQRQRQTVTIPGVQLPPERRSVDSHALSLPASFELDLWGRLARSEEGARADLLQAEENRRVVAQTVAAETVNLYLQMESLERRIGINLISVENFERNLRLIEGRYRRGLTSILEVRQARRALAGAEALLPSLRQDFGLTQQRLAVLMGRYPETRAARTHPDDYFRVLAPVPPGLPSELLLRRPDIRAAESMLRALNARVGAAKASRFPSISLTASFGYSSEDLSRLFKPESELWNLAMGIVQPLFDAGKLKAGQRAAEARYEQGLADYAKTVLTAFSEVEGALLARREQLVRRQRHLSFLKEARSTQEVAETRYRKGLVDYLTVLEAQRARYLAEETIVLVDLAILTNRVTLHRALGGGWARLPPVEAAGKGGFFGF
jgi:outer membrane protein, multidrug efflux system